MSIAKEKNRFLMEAVWTRFFPLTFELQKILFEEQAIGEIRRLQSDFSMDFIDSERTADLQVHLKTGWIV